MKRKTDQTQRKSREKVVLFKEFDSQRSNKNSKRNSKKKQTQQENYSKKYNRYAFQEDECESSFELQNDGANKPTQNKQNIERLLQRLGLNTNQVRKSENQEVELVVNNFVENCIDTVNRDSNTEEYEKLYEAEYKSNLNEIQDKASIFVSELTDLEKLNKLNSGGLVGIYKHIKIFLKNISMACEVVVQHSIFQVFILTIIFLNSIKMAVDDPLAQETSLPAAQNAFTAIYAIEMTIKIVAFGLIFQKGSYLRDAWNILDFIIVITSLLPLIVNIGFSVSALRAIRVLRPLKTITKIRALKMIVKTLFHSFSLVLDSLYILLFVMFVFGIAGMQLFGGNLKLRCMNLSDGSLGSNFCGTNDDCGLGEICAKGIQSPNFSIINFDTFFWSYLSVFQTITLQGWSDIMIRIQETSGYFYCLYSIMIVFLCEYVLLNMTMAILKYKYSQVKQNTIEQEEEECEEYEIDFLKRIGIHQDITSLQIDAPLVRYRNQDKIPIGCSESSNSIDNKLSLDSIDIFNFNIDPKTSQKIINLQSNNLDLAQLKIIGKVSDQKWDAKILQFESNDVVQKDAFEDKNQQDKLDDVEEQKREESSDQSLQFEEQQIFSQSSEEERQKQYEIADKVMQMKNLLKYSEKQINGKLPKQDLFLKKSSQEIEIKKPSVKKEISELDELLSLIGMRANTKIKPEAFRVNIPEIEIENIHSQNLYNHFQDLGDYQLKRFNKPNQLANYQIKQNIVAKVKPSKKNQALIKDMIDENSLDIKELQKKNQLQKKVLKCRIKEGQIIDQTRIYDHTRIIVSEKQIQSENKQNQIKQNLSNLTFNIIYRNNRAQQEKKGGIIYSRNLINEKCILKIPEMISISQKQSKKDKVESDSPSDKKQTNDYLKLLQNHQVEEKIQMSLQRITISFFKKVQTKKNVVSKQKQNFSDEYLKIRQEDILKKHGNVHLDFPIKTKKTNYVQKINMKSEEYQVYVKGFLGFLNVIRKKAQLIITSNYYDNFVLVIVLINTLIMSLNGFVDIDQEPYASINLACTYIFIMDLSIKLLVYWLDFFGDIMNLFDALVVVISIIEISMGSSNLSALRSIRILRAFRVLRITRLIRSLSYMKIVMGVVNSVINQFIYIFLLLFLFIFIYTLLGMQIFGGNTLPQSMTNVRQNFDSFFDSIFSVFQVVTMQNWNDIETSVLTSSLGYPGIIFLISLIFIGNWILMNLLQAVLLDGFDNDSVDEEDEQEIQYQPSEEEEQEIASSVDNILSNENQSQTGKGTARIIKEGQQENSLFLFEADNPIRRISTIITKSKVFEVLMFITILISSTKLALDSYLPKESPLQTYSDIADLIFNFIFITESFLKIISQGLILGQKAYLKDGWNKLDFFIVITSILDMLLSSVNLSILKLLRTLRPLRIISRNEEIKIIVVSLGQSVYGIMNVLIIIICIFMMFAILGINLLQGKLNYCSPNPQQLVTSLYGPYNTDQLACTTAGGLWTTQLINFQNIASSMLSLYVFSTRQNWPFFAYTFIDATEDGPKQNNSQIVFFLFCVVFIFIGSLFFMDLLVGVLFMNFHQSQHKIRPKKLTDKQINWKNLQKIIVSEDPCFLLYLQPQNIFRKYLFRLVTSKVFEIFITLAIIVNIIGMLINNDDVSQDYSNSLVTLNTVCSYIFIVQLVLKLMAFLKAYFYSAWNVFDFFVVCASVLDIVLSASGATSQGSSAISILPQIARIFRVLRITRLLRMFKQFKGLQKLIQTFIFSFPALGRGLSILFLFLFITSILASNLLGNISGDFGGHMDSIRNYNDFHHAFQMLFINLTGQNWYFYMFYSTTPGYVQCFDPELACTSSLNILFWIPFMFFGQKVFLQLFVLIVLDQFEANYINQNNPLGVYTLFQEDFREKWIQVTSKYHSQKIESKRLIDLLMALRPPLGLGRVQTLEKYRQQLHDNEKISQSQIQLKVNELDRKIKKNGAKLLHKMNIMKNRIYFGYHETFYNFAKLATVSQFYDDASSQQKLQLDSLHKESQQSLQKLKPNGNLFYYDENDTDYEPLNPISLILFTQMIVKSWHNYSIKHRKDKNTIQENNKKGFRENVFQSLNQSCASDIEEARYQKMSNNKKLQNRRGGIMETKNQIVERNSSFKAMPNITAHYGEEKGKSKKYKLSILRNGQRQSVDKRNSSILKTKKGSFQ